MKTLKRRIAAIEERMKPMIIPEMPEGLDGVAEVVWALKYWTLEEIVSGSWEVA